MLQQGNRQKKTIKTVRDWKNYLLRLLALGRDVKPTMELKALCCITGWKGHCIVIRKSVSCWSMLKVSAATND